MKNILALIITLFFLFEGHSQMQGKVYVNSDKGDIVYFINDSLFIWITTCDKIEAGCFEMNIQGDFGIKNIKKVFDHFDFNNNLTDFGISAYLYTFDKNKILVDSNFEFYFEPKKKLNSNSGKHSFDYIGKYKKKNNLESIVIKRNKVDTVRIYVKNSEKVVRDLQEYVRLNFYKKRGNKFYVDEKKKLNERVVKKYRKILFDQDEEKSIFLEKYYFVYYIDNVRCKEAGMIMDFGDGGLIKIYHENGQLASIGVAFMLEKIGYWIYYENNKAVRVEYYEDKRNELLGIEHNLPKLDSLVPKELEIIKIKNN